MLVGAVWDNTCSAIYGLLCELLEPSARIRYEFRAILVRCVSDFWHNRLASSSFGSSGRDAQWEIHVWQPNIIHVRFQLQNSKPWLAHWGLLRPHRHLWQVLSVTKQTKKVKLMVSFKPKNHLDFRFFKSLYSVLWLSLCVSFRWWEEFSSFNQRKMKTKQMITNWTFNPHCACSHYFEHIV